MSIFITKYDITTFFVSSQLLGRLQLLALVWGSFHFMVFLLLTSWAGLADQLPGVWGKVWRSRSGNSSFCQEQLEEGDQAWDKLRGYSVLGWATFWHNHSGLCLPISKQINLLESGFTFWSTCKKSGSGGPPAPPYLEKSRFDWVFLNDGVPK